MVYPRMLERPPTNRQIPKPGPLKASSMERLYFLYHELRPEPSPYSYVISCTEFEEHLRLYAAVQEGSEAGRLRPEITFDDGNLSDSEYALSLLQAAGLRAHFFITAGWTGQRSGFMADVDLRRLQTAGMTIGAHGWSHKLLTACSDAELRVELVDAKSRLEHALGAAVETMSLPGGRFNRRVLQACGEAGYTAVFTSEPKVKGESAAAAPEPTIGRLNLRSGTTTAWLRQVLDPATGALAKLQRSDRLKGMAKLALGDRLYAKAWALANRHEEAPEAPAES